MLAAAVGQMVFQPTPQFTQGLAEMAVQLHQLTAHAAVIEVVGVGVLADLEQTLLRLLRVPQEV